MTAVGADLFDVRGRVVAVTGGLGRLGRRWVLALLERGARVAVLDAAATAALAPERFGDRAGDDALLCLPADVTSRPAVEEALAATARRWGVPHALVNAAALDAPPDAPASENGPFEEYPAESLSRVLKVNVGGVVTCCQVIGGAMAAAGRGSVVNVGSIYGEVSPDQRIYEYRRSAGEPFYKPVSYALSKSALMNLGRYLATYWAPRGVRVNTLVLGGVFDGQPAPFLAGYEARVPLGRMAREGEYDGAVVFLVSDASSYMTGASLVLDGGWTAW